MTSAMVNTPIAIWRVAGRAIGSHLANASAVRQERTFSSKDQKVGFIGLGNMGGHMVTNLRNKGFGVSVYDLSKDATSAMAKIGAEVCKSSNDVASSGTGPIITMLPNNKIVMDVYCGDNGILSNAKKGSMLIDSSTVDPNVAKTISAEAKSKGHVFIDAPVSGGVVGARDGTLTFMVGGEEKDCHVAEPVLMAMGSRVVHCGPVGSGLIAKICNNMLLGISMMGTSECMNLAIRLGLDPKVFMGIVNTSTGRCWSSEIYNPVPGLMENVPSSNDYAGGFASKLMSKDLGLASNLATDSLTPIPLGSLAHNYFFSMLSKGYADKDFSAIYDFLKENK